MLSTLVSDIHLDSCLMNAAGCWCYSMGDLDQLNQSATGAVVSKSGTISPRIGNPEPRFYCNQHGSINSMGIPNLGYKFHSLYGMTISKTISKPFIQSIYPFDTNELSMMLHDINSVLDKRQLVEINISCPNVNNFSDIEKWLDTINQTRYYRLSIGFKLKPYYDNQHFDIVANLLKKYSNRIKFITCINSIVNGLIVDHQNEKPVIVPNNGLGGIGGIYCKPTALSNVYNFYQRIPHDMSIIGCGGITCGVDAFEHILCGASAIQIGTQLVMEGPAVFDRVGSELINLMETKKYQSLADFKGRLKN